jgi:hypothetical protein
MYKYLALFFVAACLPSLAQATTIDFQEFTPDSSGLGSITSKGYTLTAVGSGLQPPDYAFFGDPDTGYAWCPDCTLTLENSSGDLFSIYSDDLTIYDFEPKQFEIIGYLSGGGTVQTFFDNGTGGGGDFSPVVFGSEWQNLERIEFGFAGVFGQGVDNIIVSSVPVPPAIWLFGSALVGLLQYRKRGKSHL